MLDRYNNGFFSGMMYTVIICATIGVLCWCGISICHLKTSIQEVRMIANKTKTELNDFKEHVYGMEYQGQINELFFDIEQVKKKLNGNKENTQ